MAPRPAAPVRLFPEVTDDLTTLSRDELQALADEHVDVARRVAANDAELLSGLSGEDVVAQMTDGVATLETIRAAIASIDEAEAAYEATVGDLAAQFGIDAPVADETPAEAVEALAAEADAEPDDDDPEAVEEPEAEASVAEPVVASAPTPLRRPAVPASHQPRIVVTERAGAPLVASMAFDRLTGGQRRRVDRTLLAQLLAESQRGMRRGDRTILASAQIDYPSERVLGSDPAENYEKIEAAFGRGPIVASGGQCAPYTPLYDLPVIASAAEPVWDSLQKFQTPRGGIQFPTPITISDVEGGVTIVTVDEDATPSSASKNVVRIDCDAFQTAEIEAIAGIVEHGNLDARAWPERVDAVARLMQVALAKNSESELLRQITAGSTVRTQAAWYGAYSTIVKGILQAAAAMRSRERMLPTEILEVLAPAWLPDLIAADLASNGDNRLDAAATRSNIEALLRRQGVNVSWYMDQDGTTTQVYGADGASALDEFLTTVAWYIFPRGTWIGLDSGRLDLGTQIRDSDLNSTNDFQTFEEVFRGVAKVGVTSFKVISTVCPDGTTAPYGSAETC